MEEKSNIHHVISEANFEKLLTEVPKDNEISKLEESSSKIKQISSPNIAQKFNTNYKNEELNKFKDEILSFFKERENYYVSKINSYQSHIESTEKKYEQMTKVIKLNYQEILSSQANLNNRLDKFNTYEQFVLKTNDNLTSHEIRINNLREDFSKATHKYDKIYLDNLELPGYIGRCAKYKNCQLFFSDIIKELNKLNNYKEKNTVDLKVYKEKLDQMIKTFKTMVDNNNEAQVKYINKTNEKNISDCKNMIDSLGERVIELRLENSKYSVELINKTNETKEQIIKIKELKAELLNEFYNKMDDYKNMNNNIIKSFNEFKNEYALIRKKFLELANFIKDIRFKKNLGIDVNKKDINNLYKNLIKKGKKSCKDKNVQLLDNTEEVEKMVFKVNNNNLNSNNIITNSNEKQLRGNKRHETYHSTNNIMNIIKDNYLGLNDNNIIKKESKENERNNNSVNGSKNKTMNFSENNEIEEKEKEKEKNKEVKKNKILLISENNLNINTEKNLKNNIYNYKDKIKKNNIKNENSEKILFYSKSNEEKPINPIQKTNNNIENNQIEISKDKNEKENKVSEIKNNNEHEHEEKCIIDKENNISNEINKNNKNNQINIDIFKNKRIQINLENKKQIKDKKQLVSAMSDTFSMSDSFSSFCNNNTMGATGTISERNLSNISIPISYNINNVKCNKFVLNDMCQEENDNKIIKELASELEQTTNKKIKKLASQKKSEKKDFQKEIIKIEPINLIKNIKNNETKINEGSNNDKCISQSQEKITIKESRHKIKSNRILSDGEQSPKININKLLNNNKLKSLINEEIETDNVNININSDNNDISNKNNNIKNENESDFKNNNNSDYNNFNVFIENNNESINKKLILFSQKLYDIETYMKEKFFDIIKQIECLRQSNKKKFNTHINPFRNSGFRQDQNVFNTINNDNFGYPNSNFSISGRDENLTNINYHTIKSPRFDLYSQLFPSDGIKNLNYFKDSILIDNWKKNQNPNNNKNEEISAIKKFIEKKINLNNSKTIYKDFPKKNLKGFIKNKNFNFYNSMNIMENNENNHSRIKNKSTVTGNDIKWIDLKVLVNKKIPKNSSCQKLNPILSGENKPNL